MLGACGRSSSCMPTSRSSVGGQQHVTVAETVVVPEERGAADDAHVVIAVLVHGNLEIAIAELQHIRVAKENSDCDRYVHIHYNLSLQQLTKR